MFLSRGDRDLGVAFQTHPGRQGAEKTDTRMTEKRFFQTWVTLHLLSGQGLGKGGLDEKATAK